MIKKFGMKEEDVDEFANLILSNASIIETRTRLNVVKDDTDDNKILEAAVDSAADYIVSGDRHLISIGSFMGIKILKPAEMLRVIKGK